MNRNPVLNSPDDITDELVRQIINNDLDSLTINYEFTRNDEDVEDCEADYEVLFGEQIKSPP